MENVGKTSETMDCRHTTSKKPLIGQPKWVSMEPSPGMVELTRCFLKVVELLEEEVRSETKEWLAKGLVAKTLG